MYKKKDIEKLETIERLIRELSEDLEVDSSDWRCLHKYSLVISGLIRNLRMLYCEPK